MRSLAAARLNLSQIRLGHQASLAWPGPRALARVSGLPRPGLTCLARAAGSAGQPGFARLHGLRPASPSAPPASALPRPGAIRVRLHLPRPYPPSIASKSRSFGPLRLPSHLPLSQPGRCQPEASVASESQLLRPQQGFTLLARAAAQLGQPPVASPGLASLRLHLPPGRGPGREKNFSCFACATVGLQVPSHLPCPGQRGQTLLSSPPSRPARTAASL